MKENKEMTEKELDDVTAGVVWVKIEGFMQRGLKGFTACEGRIVDVAKVKICDGTVFPKVKITNPDPSEVR